MAALLAAALLATLGLAAAQSLAPFSTGLLDDIIARRVAIAKDLEAEREALVGQATAVAKSLGTLSQPTLPTVEVPNPPNYLDLSAAGDTQLAAVDLTAVRGRYPRKPRVSRPHPVLLSGCPTSNSVKKFGAAGDNSRDEAGAIQRAMKRLPFLYFPPGTYRISSDLKIYKPIYAASGAWFNVDGGRTLTFTKRPHHWNLGQGLFGGAGRIRMTSGVDSVHPEWFKSWGRSDSDALQYAADACADRCTIVLSRNYVITRAWNLRPNVGVFATNAGQLDGRQSPDGAGVVLNSGKYRRPLTFGTFWGFTNFAIKIKGGVVGAEIQLNAIIDGGGDGIVFSPGEGSDTTINSVSVTHFTATNGPQNTVVIRGSSPAHKLRNCVVRGNFVLSGGRLHPTRAAAGLDIQGRVAPTLENSAVIFQAVEAAGGSSKYAFLQNSASTPVRNLVYKAEAWAGGVPSSGTILDGGFNGLQALVKFAGGITTPREWGTIKGPNNAVTWGLIGSAGVEYIMPTSPNKDAFNQGNPVLDQIFYLNAPIQGTWQPGEVRTFYFWGAFARTCGARIHYIIFRAANTGIVCAGFDNQQGQQDGRVAVRLKNAAAYAVPSWLPAHRFGVQLGP